MSKDLEIIKKKFIGDFITGFRVGDIWELYIGDYCLLAQNIEFDNEKRMEALLQNHYPEISFTVDKEDVPKATLMTANLRKLIIGAHLDERKNLTIDFEKGSSLKVLTNVDIVDWQWCVNKTGNIPYLDFEIACFWEGQIEINE